MKKTSSFRLIAIYEATKGVAVFFFGIGLLYFLNHEAQKVVLNIVTYLHISPTRHLIQLLLNSSGILTPNKIYILEGTALIYSGLRFLEAYGLWFQKNWGRLLAIISTGIYLPFEIYEWVVGTTLLKIIITSVNIFLFVVLIIKRK